MSVYLYIRRRQWHPTPVLLPGKSHGWRSLVGYSPCGCWESDTTERLYSHFSLACIGEGSGNPLPCSCLENPRDWGAWWASVYGVAQSRTQMKWLSSSSRHWRRDVYWTWRHGKWNYTNEAPKNEWKRVHCFLIFLIVQICQRYDKSFQSLPALKWLYFDFMLKGYFYWI